MLVWRFAESRIREPHQRPVSGLTANESQSLNGMERPMYFERNMREREDRDVPQTLIYTKTKKSHTNSVDLEVAASVGVGDLYLEKREKK